MPPYKLFSTARSYLLGLIKMFYTTGYFTVTIYICISTFMFDKSTPTFIFLRFTIIQIQVFLSLILSFIKFYIFSQVYIVWTTRGHHTIIFHTKPFELTFRDCCGINLNLKKICISLCVYPCVYILVCIFWVYPWKLLFAALKDNQLPLYLRCMPWIFCCLFCFMCHSMCK
jgi:hypothetical protein